MDLFGLKLGYPEAEIRLTLSWRICHIYAGFVLVLCPGSMELS